MKKILLLAVVFICCQSAFKAKAESETKFRIVTAGSSVTAVSQNGKYIVGGNQTGVSFVYDTETEELDIIQEGTNTGIHITGASNNGLMVGRYGQEQGSTKPATYNHKTGEWTLLPSNDMYGTAWRITPDESLIVGYIFINGTQYHACIWNKTDEGYELEMLPNPETDALGMAVYGTNAIAVSDDGNTIIGRLTPTYESASDTYPMAWKKTEDGYVYDMIGERIHYNEHVPVPDVDLYEEDFDQWFEQYQQYRTLYTVMPYTIDISGNGKYMVSGVFYFDIDFTTPPYFFQKRYVIRYNLEDDTYIYIPDERSDDIYGSFVTNGGTIFGTTPYLSLVRTALVYEDEESPSSEIGEWMAERFNIEFPSDIEYTGTPFGSSDGRLIGSYYLDGSTPKFFYAKETVAIESITLNISEKTLEIDEELQLTATIEPNNTNNKNIIWTSNNEVVATVNGNGLVKAISEGNAIITARAENGGKTATCEITVKGGSVGIDDNDVDGLELLSKEYFTISGISLGTKVTEKGIYIVKYTYTNGYTRFVKEFVKDLN